MDWHFLLDNAFKIIAIFAVAISVIISPLVLLRWLRTRNELVEIQTFVKKNVIIREEMAAMNNMLSEHTERIHALELELHQSVLINKTLMDENQRLHLSNTILKKKIGELENKTDD